MASILHLKKPPQESVKIETRCFVLISKLHNTSCYYSNVCNLYINIFILHHCLTCIIPFIAYIMQSWKVLYLFFFWLSCLSSTIFHFPSYINPICLCMLVFNAKYLIWVVSYLYLIVAYIFLTSHW